MSTFFRPAIVYPLDWTGQNWKSSWPAAMEDSVHGVSIPIFAAETIGSQGARMTISYLPATTTSQATSQDARGLDDTFSRASVSPKKYR